ncbi:MAG: 4'-phosphopantetheinyl transferase superfamily protein [Xanthomonadales bacterium]|nr:4'-phosphopantetheinyl transferase superfamily protein [Xanthomonadales bacterium]
MVTPTVLAMWTAKEAVLKALGRGLAYGLERVVIGFDGTLPVLLSVDGQAASDQDWHLVLLDPPQPDWIAALAWQGPPLTLTVDTRSCV